MANERETRLRDRDPMEDVLRAQEYQGMGSLTAQGTGRVVPASQIGDTQVQVMGEVVTAQRVAVPRVTADIRAEIKALAAMAGARWVYRIPFKNNKTGQTEWVKGPTVKCTNSVFRAYGNCHLTTRVFSEGDSWIFYSRIVDLQRGSTYDRPYQQRKVMNTGMKDGGRAGDINFQIGVSKSQRNVVSNFLEDLVAYAREEAEKGVLERVNKNPDGARTWILSQLDDMKIDKKRVELVYGRTAEHWTTFDMAKMFAELSGIEDQMIDADDIYPKPEDVTAKREASNPLAGNQGQGVGTAGNGAPAGGAEAERKSYPPGSEPYTGTGGARDTTKAGGGVYMPDGKPPGETMDNADATLGGGTKPQADPHPAKKAAGKKKANLFGGDA